MAIDLVVSGILDGRRVRKQFRGAAHREARAFAKTLSNTTVVYAARTRVNGRQVTRHFDRKIDVEGWLAEQTLGRQRGRAIATTGARVTVELYGRRYLERHRVNLAENTAELYEHLFTKHIVAGLGATVVGELTTEDVDIWFGGLRAGVPSTAAKAYRLLRQIMNSAVEDGLRAGSPCRIKNGGTDPESDPPSISVGEVAALAEAMPANLQPAVLLACWTSLRRGEILGLRRRDIDVGEGTITICQTKVATVKNNVVVKEPTSRAGQRILHIHRTSSLGWGPTSITMSGRLPMMPSSTAPSTSFISLGSGLEGQSTVRTCTSATCARPVQTRCACWGDYRRDNASGRSLNRDYRPALPACRGRTRLGPRRRHGRTRPLDRTFADIRLAASRRTTLRWSGDNEGVAYGWARYPPRRGVHFSARECGCRSRR